MKRICLMAVLALVLGGCSVGRVAPQAALFDLGPEPTASVQLPARAPIVLAFSAAPSLSDTGVIWRVADSTAPKAYAGFRWSEPPASLVRQRLQERLSHEGAVLSDGGGTGAPQLRVTLTRFEQVFAADGSSSQGQVVLQAVVLQDGKILGQRRFAAEAAAPSQDASGGVAALRLATDSAAESLAAWLPTVLRPIAR
ncbi:ABC-type transport auxiliary lipoprotein family protein [Bordetella holmesii]|uniref:PF03886 family protein n=2 Tax=Bordetella holmesii TaxID=35814 RepID=A0A158M290_9BORD|nr:ABC-type transport auxiliary lipoprotein family protein [Bordetella holmesii]AIT25956.1 hypothetical protein D558_1278 [Bordetella holmesii 44057]EWM41551.1 hypothetical protein D556_1289 [Bordetella holmesii 41130]EWM46527.1 hypothetical protein D555_1302 [Bordetella holmesii 35009]EWM50692.1 hypothetical protein D557_0537 [Bordetella holmesii 70147]AMD49502.1 hypothetical protein F783_012320 [Bordetella holmesii F627]